MKKVEPGHRRLLIILAAMTMFTPMAIDMYLPTFPSLAQDLNVHIANLQLTLTSFLVGVSLGQIFWGPISDRFGRKAPSYIGIAIYIAASAASTLSTSLTTLIILRFFQAFGGSAALVCGRAIVRDMLHGVEMAKMMSAMAMLFVLAPAFAPTIGSTLLKFFSWHSIFWLLVLFGVAVALGMRSIPESLAPENRNDHGFSDAAKSYRELVGNKDFRTASMIGISGSMVTFAYVSSAPAVLMGEFGVSRTTFGLLFGLVSIGLLASSRINIWLVGRFGLVKMMRGFTAVQTSATLALLVISLIHAPLWLMLIFVIITFGCAPGLGGNAMTFGMHPFPRKAASAAALLGSLQFVGSAFISAILAIFHANVILNMAIAMFIGALLAV
ncbi:MAG: multidrug effflux MFS transporter [Candidatus Planktophila sp.]